MGKFIKRSILFVTALVVLSLATHAQSAFSEDTKVVQVGVGLGRYGNWAYNRNYSSRLYLPSTLLSAEMALPKKVGPGLIGLGLQFAWHHSTYKYKTNYSNGNYNEKSSYTNYGLGLRVLYHLTELDLDELDLYGGLLTGPNYGRYKYYESYDGIPPYTTNTSSFGYAGWSYGGIIGARYYFQPGMAGVAELQWAWRMPFLNVGLAFKL